MAYDAICSDDLIDAFYDGWDAFGKNLLCPFEAGPLADEWYAGREDAKRARLRRVAPVSRPEGYFHQNPRGEV